MRPGRSDSRFVPHLVSSSVLALGTIGVLVPACIPGPASVTGTVSETDSGPSTATSSTADTMSLGGSVEGSAGGSSAADGTSGSSGPIPSDPCLLSPPEACPLDRCMVIDALVDTGSSPCGVLAGQSDLSLCVSAGAPIPPGTRTAIYAEIDGQRLYAFTGHTCQLDALSRFPAQWSECSLDPAEPELCRCLCGVDGCPHEVDRVSLDGCGLPTPCGPLDPHDFDKSEYSEYDRCVLTALRDRTPGAYAIELGGGFSSAETRAYLGGRDEVQIIYRAQDDLCLGPIEDAWWPTRICTLQPPAWFDDCLMVGMDLEQQYQCLDGLDWGQDCVEAPARCP